MSSKLPPKGTNQGKPERIPGEGGGVWGYHIEAPGKKTGRELNLWERGTRRGKLRKLGQSSREELKQKTPHSKKLLGEKSKVRKCNHFHAIGFWKHTRGSSVAPAGKAHSLLEEQCLHLVDEKNPRSSSLYVIKKKMTIRTLEERN